MALGGFVNCFDWQNHSSDYLDGTLVGASRLQADEHLDSCRSCGSRHQRYRIILSSIAGQPRSTLPVPIRKAPLSFSLPRTDSFARRSRWERAPWYVRTGVEGVTIAVAILFVVAMAPRIRSLYERGLQRRLDEFSLEATLSDTAPDSPLTRGRSLPSMQKAAGSVVSDDFSSEAETEAEPVRVGQSEIWRFNFRTNSPRELRNKIVQILKDAGVSAESNVGGAEFPGGIQFDLLVPVETLAQIKQQLQKLTVGLIHPPAAAETLEDSDAGTAAREPFTWYKVKSKRALPAGKTRVVIWLSQV